MDDKAVPPYLCTSESPRRFVLRPYIDVFCRLVLPATLSTGCNTNPTILNFGMGKHRFWSPFDIRYQTMPIIFQGRNSRGRFLTLFLGLSSSLSSLPQTIPPRFSMDCAKQKTQCMGHRELDGFYIKSEICAGSLECISGQIGMPFGS